MKLYKLDIDVAKPIRQALKVTVGSEPYGIVVSATKDGRKIRNLSCSIADGNDTYQPTSVNDDGSFMFTLSSDAKATSREIEVQLSACPTVLDGYTKISTVRKDAFIQVSLSAHLLSGDYYEDEMNLLGWKQKNLNQISAVSNDIELVGGKLLYQMIGADVPYSNANLINIPTSGIDYTDHVDFQNGNVLYQLPAGPILKLTKDCTVNANVMLYGNHQGSAAAQQVSINVPPSYIGYEVACKVKAQLTETKDAEADAYVKDEVDFTNVAATNLSADTFALSGVSYIPTILSVDGVAYTVLAVATTNE